MTKTIENLFIFLATYTSLLPILCIGFFYKKTLNSRIFNFLLVYAITEFITNISATIIDPYSVEGAFTIKILYSIFTIAEYILFACIFFSILTSRTIKFIIKISSVLFVAFSIIYFLFAKYKALDSIPIGVETVFMISFSFYYLYEIMEDSSQVLVYNRFTFWIVAGILIYLAGSFFIYVFANQVDSKTRQEIWVFTNVFTVIKNLCFLFSVLIFTKKETINKSISPFLN
jgi:hypothetical protein